MGERMTGGFGAEDVELFGADALETLARSAGSGDPDDMADYLEKHGDADIADYAAVAVENAAGGCLSALFGTCFAGKIGSKK
ncbi:MAG: hypothetical protein M1120_03010 [Patescibacteria group bacterium]|nr:hypothetical protein [Patescibacteria group bacterium]